jgi:outer membrane protein assembly factor BamA
MKLNKHKWVGFLATSWVCTLPFVNLAQAEPAGQLSFGVSHSSHYGTRGNIDVLFEDLWVDGLSFGARFLMGQSGLGGKMLVSRDWDLNTPVFGYDVEMLVSLSISDQDWDYDSFQITSYEAVIGARSEITPDLNVTAELIWNITDLSDFDQSTSSFILLDEGNSTSAGLRLSSDYDTRPNSRLTTAGTTSNFALYLPFLGDNDRDFVQVDASYGHTVPVFGSMSLKLAATGGAVISDDDELVNVLDRSFSAQGLPRGFDFGGAGPRDILTDTALGGTRYLAGSVELLTPINQRDWTAGVFYDVGSAWDVSGVIDANVIEDRTSRSSFGVTLNIPTGIGDLKITYAEPILALDTDELNDIIFSLNSRF